MWDWAIWGALIVVAVVGIAALALFAVHVRRAWRDARETNRETLRRLDEFAGKAEAVSERLAATGDKTAELEGSLKHLHVSLAQLAVLRAALGEVDSPVGRVAAYLPRK